MTPVPLEPNTDLYTSPVLHVHRNTPYNHKLFATGSPSSVILDFFCVLVLRPGYRGLVPLRQPFPPSVRNPGSEDHVGCVV